MLEIKNTNKGQQSGINFLADYLKKNLIDQQIINSNFFINYVFQDISFFFGGAVRLNEGSLTKMSIQIAVWISERDGPPRFTQKNDTTLWRQMLSTEPKKRG